MAGTYQDGHPPIQVISMTQHTHSNVTTSLQLSLPSSLRITDRSFRYASSCLWIQLPPSMRQPHSTADSSLSLSASFIFTVCVPSPLSSSVTPSLFHSRLKTCLFSNHSHHTLCSIFSGLTPRLLVYFWYF